MHMEDHRLYSLSFHHRGASKFWVVVRPSSAARLEACLALCMEEMFGLEWATPRCSQFVRHMSVWVSLEKLGEWRVAFELVEQRAGNLIITASGANHQGWNAGDTEAETINYANSAAAWRLAGYC